jgi:hypothetical protein
MPASALSGTSIVATALFYARMSVEDVQGRKKLAWVPLDVSTVAGAQDELRRVRVEREDNPLRHIGESPIFEKYYTATYLPLLKAAGKKPRT